MEIKSTKKNRRDVRVVMGGMKQMINKEPNGKKESKHQDVGGGHRGTCL